MGNGSEGTTAGLDGARDRGLHGCFVDSGGALKMVRLKHLLIRGIDFDIVNLRNNTGNYLIF